MRNATGFAAALAMLIGVPAMGSGVMSFSHQPSEARGRQSHQRVFAPVTRVAWVYATFGALETNPVPVGDHRPRCAQIVALGEPDGARVRPAVSFGIAQDTHSGMGDRAFLLPWVADGAFDSYGMYARPKTPYDFRIRLDLRKGLMTAWVCGHGDDGWFLLAEGAPLQNPVSAISLARVDQNEGAPGVQLVVRAAPDPDRDAVCPHPLAGRPGAPKLVDGARTQNMRSLWQEPGRHVIIARNNPRLTPKESAWVGFPDVVHTGGRRLVCVFAAGGAHGAGGPMLITRSNDVGKTWSEPVAIHPTGINCPRIQKLADGSLLALADIAADRTYCVVFYRSMDGGATWESAGYLDPPQCGGRGACVPSRVAELPDGSWLVVGSSSSGPAFELTEGERLEVFRSTDRGGAWTLHSLIQEHPRSLSEASIVPGEGGRLWLFAREGCRMLPGVKTHSDDGGRTWAPCEELPFPVVGRTCAASLSDGRVMLTTRYGVGRSGLWAWTGAPEEETASRIVGAHFNDATSVGLRDGGLHVANDGLRGQFTQYFLRVPDSPESTIDVTTELKVISNAGCAATLSVPYVGEFRFFPDRIMLAHAPSVSVPVAPGRFHTYRIEAAADRFSLSIDGEEALSSDEGDARTVRSDWTPVKLSPYPFAFGNEPAFISSYEYTEARGEATADEWTAKHDQAVDALSPQQAIPPVLMLGMTVARDQIRPSVTGYSVWRRVSAVCSDPVTGSRRQDWSAGRDGFPDQYQLDRVIEIDATIGGGDQGYSGWAELPDGRVFVVNYTDDRSPACLNTPNWPSGLPYIRGTYVLPAELTPRR